MDLIYKQAQENFTKMMKDLVDKPDFDVFIKSLSKEEFIDTFWGLMRVYSRYQKYISPSPTVRDVNDNIIKLAEVFFSKLETGEINTCDIIDLVKGDCSEERLVELDRKFYCVEKEYSSGESSSEEEEQEDDKEEGK